MKKNCWQWKQCERQPGGAKVAELGVCPASTEAKHNGKNGGSNAGRYCWKVAGTLCKGKVQGSYANKIMDCVRCEFYQKVKEEEGKDFFA